MAEGGPRIEETRHIGERLVRALGKPATRELLEILERSDADRAALMGRLHVREDATWLAELSF